MKHYTPDEFKEYWKDKYNNWKCFLNGKDEWICGNGKVSGRIISRIDDQGAEYPDIELREAVSTGGFGLNIWSTALKSLGKSSKSKDSEQSK